MILNAYSMAQEKNMKEERGGSEDEMHRWYPEGYRTYEK